MKLDARCNPVEMVICHKGNMPIFELVALLTGR